MENRGAYGFRINHEDKVTYNRWDSYPKWLGKNVLDYVASTPLVKMREVAANIVLVQNASKLTAELIEQYHHYADVSVPEQKRDDWYCLLRSAQGEMHSYNRDLRHMIDGSAFLADSLLCQWAYIVNLDTEEIEVYRGNNRDSHAPGRYAGLYLPDNYGYHGVALRKEIPLLYVKQHILDNLVAELDELSFTRVGDYFD